MDNPLIKKELQPINNETAPTKAEFSHTPKQEQEKNKELREINTEQNQPRENAILKKHRSLLTNPRKLPRDIPLPKDAVAIAVENILEDGLREQFDKMSPIAKQEFKLKGEQTAYKIRDLLQSSKIKVKKIFKLIVGWLSLLPGVNRFFLEQEAKIKTDQIIAIKKQNGH
jgi:hypothetical protein